MKKSPFSLTASITAAHTAFIQKKIPSWAAAGDLIYPNRLCLEQCSGENAAHYKGELVKRLFPEGGKEMADLTGGLGVDFSFVARHFKSAIYVERQQALCEAARHNFPLLGLNDVTIVEGDGTDFLKEMPSVDLIFMDPARRDSVGRKTVFIEDCEPNVLELLPLFWEKSSITILKLSPMLDLSRAIASLGCVAEAHIVADNGECKELLLVLRPDANGPRIFCADGIHTLSFSPEEESEAIVNYTSELGHYLYEPNAAVMKAGAFKLTAQRFGLNKLHPNSHLYTSDTWQPDFPGRSFIINGVRSFAKKELKELCQSVDKANLTIRNFPGSVAELRKRLKMKEGGDAYWFATTLANEKHVIIDCRKP